MLKAWVSSEVKLMKVIDRYLSMLQEQYNPSIAISNIGGDFKLAWTDCYESRCTKEIESKYEQAYCKTECHIAAANNAITKLNAEMSNCASTREPKRCIESLKKAVESYRNKILSAREMQDKIASREANFRRQTAGV
jgi:hypothetical protein